jgi:hypothetical protein
MKRTSLHRFVAAFAIALTIVSAAMAQSGMRMRRGPGMQAAQEQGARRMDSLARLKRALENANAPALAADQEQKINDLLTALRESRQGGRDDTTLRSARQALENAILARDSAAAAAQASIIADHMQRQTAQRLQDRANLAINVLGVLSADQQSALQNRIGNDGLVRLVSSLGGGAGFRGGKRR